MGEFNFDWGYLLTFFMFEFHFDEISDDFFMGEFHFDSEI